MKTHVEQLDGNNVRLTVTLSVEEVDEAVDHAYKSMAKKIKIPGFRAGKAPKPVIDTHIGREAVLADAQDELLTKSYSEALDAEELRPIAQPDIGEIESLEPGVEFEYSGEVEIRPELVLSSTEGLKITVPPKEASEQDIDTQIDTMREKYATLEPVDDRAVEVDDFVLISFVGTVDGEEYEGNTVDKYLYEMNRGLMPSDFDEGLIGVKPGEECQVSFAVPDSSTDPEAVGKTVSFDITVHEIKVRVLPEVDNEFSYTVGGFDTVEELRESVREQLNQEKEMGFNRAREDNARAAIAERLEGDIPEVMIESTRQQMKRDFESGLKAREITLEQYFSQSGQTVEEFEEQVTVEATRSIREELALEALYRDKGLEVTDEDIDIEIALFAVGAGDETADVRKRWEATGLMPVVIEQVQHKKATMWMIGNIEIVEDAGDDEADLVEESADDAEPTSDDSEE